MIFGVTPLSNGQKIKQTNIMQQSNSLVAELVKTLVNDEKWRYEKELKEKFNNEY